MSVFPFLFSLSLTLENYYDGRNISKIMLIMLGALMGGEFSNLNHQYVYSVLIVIINKNSATGQNLAVVNQLIRFMFIIKQTESK